MAWYGNGPPPENRFYGSLATGARNADTMRKLQEKLDRKKIELLKLQYPTLASIYDDIDAANEDLAQSKEQAKNAQKTLSKLNKELIVLKKLYGEE